PAAPGFPRPVESSQKLLDVYIQQATSRLYRDLASERLSQKRVCQRPEAEREKNRQQLRIHGEDVAHQIFRHHGRARFQGDRPLPKPDRFPITRASMIDPRCTPQIAKPDTSSMPLTPV